MDIKRLAENVSNMDSFVPTKGFWLGIPRIETVEDELDRAEKYMEKLREYARELRVVNNALQQQRRVVNNALQQQRRKDRLECSDNSIEKLCGTVAKRLLTEVLHRYCHDTDFEDFQQIDEWLDMIEAAGGGE